MMDKEKQEELLSTLGNNQTISNIQNKIDKLPIEDSISMTLYTVVSLNRRLSKIIAFTDKYSQILLES